MSVSGLLQADDDDELKKNANIIIIILDEVLIGNSSLLALNIQIMNFNISFSQRQS